MPQTTEQINETIDKGETIVLTAGEGDTCVFGIGWFRRMGAL
jgi:uncharacterized protein (DUF39 family)